MLRPLIELKDVRALAVLHKELRPLLLRRTKESRTADGAPIIRLPPRHVIIERLLFSEEEKDFYDALRSRSRVRVDMRMRMHIHMHA